LGRNNRLSLVRPLTLKTDYLVSIKYYEDNKLEPNNRIDFSVSVQFLEKTDHHYRLRISKYNIFLNRREPAMVIEQISNEINKALYPLDILIDFSGNFFEVTNLSMIQNRWLKTKVKLKKEYKGNIIESLIKETESIMNSSTKLEIAFSNDIFWSVFFASNYISYGDSLQVDKSMAFPLNPYATCLLYEGTSKINSFLSKYKTVEIAFEGHTKIPKNNPLYVGKQNTSDLVSKLEVKYDLDEEHFIPIWVDATCTVYNEKDQELIKRIHTSIVKENKSIS
jgi:hypothetical protein